MITSGGERRRQASASKTSPATATADPLWVKKRLIVVRTIGSSSTTRIRDVTASTLRQARDGAAVVPSPRPARFQVNGPAPRRDHGGRGKSNIVAASIDSSSTYARRGPRRRRIFGRSR